MTEPIKINMAFQPEDIRKAVWWLVRIRVFGTTAIWLGLLLGLMAAGILNFRPEIVIIAILTGPATASFLCWLQTNNVAIQARSCDITLDDSGMSVLPDKPPVVTTREWRDFTAVKESKDAFIFIAKDKQIFPLLKRHLIQLDEIRDLISRHLGDRAHLRSTSV